MKTDVPPVTRINRGDLSWQNPNPPPEETSSDKTQPKASRGGLFRLIRAGVILLVIVVAECAMAMIFFPSAEETAAMAQKLAQGDQELQLPGEEQAKEEAKEEKTIEEPLGIFKVSIFQPLSGSTLRLDFDLYCTVLAEDEEDFLERKEKHERRLRDQIITILRGTEENDLTEAGLGLIKRKVLETTNRTLGKAVVHEIIFSDFSHEEH